MVNEVKNSVKYLQTNNFLRLPIYEQIEIKNLGPSRPDLSLTQFAASRTASYLRKFNSDIYDKHKWLTGCTVRNALFCFPCLLFGGDSTWAMAGVTDLKHMNEKIKKHEISVQHLKNVYDLAILGAVNIACVQRVEDFRQTINTHNENVSKNRIILSKIIDCIKFCGKFELSSMRSNVEEMDRSMNQEILDSLLEFAEKFLDENLKNHFLNSTLFQGTCQTVENELLDCMLNVCHDEICQEIDKAKFLCLMSTDTSTVSQLVQQAIIFRYELAGTVYERFWGFSRPKSQTVEDLAECIIEQLNLVLNEQSEKLIAQTFDDAAAVGGNEKSGVQTIIKELFKNAHFVHCYTEKLDVIMEKAASQNGQARIFFSSLAEIARFFKKSPKRLATLYKMSRDRDLVWDFTGNLMSAISENKDILKQCLETLQIDKDEATLQGATSLLRTLDDEDFNFWLKFFHEIMPYVEDFYSKLQNYNNASSVNIYDTVKEFIEVINQKRNEPVTVIIKEEEDFPKAKRARISPENCILSTKEICDYFICAAMQRFSFRKHLSAVKLFSPCFFKENVFKFSTPSFEIQETIEAYPFLDKARLTNELRVFYERPEYKNMSGFMEIYQIMYNTGISEVLVEVFKLVRIIITTPMITTEPGRCFSTVERIKSFLNGRLMETERLTPLAMLSLEKVMIETMSNFNERVIDKFANLENRKEDFSYK